MEALSAVTCVTFVEADPDVDANYIQFENGPDGCYGTIGRKKKGMQVLNLADECFYTIYTVAHELIHALGFWHMHCAADRDKYVKVLWDNIDPSIKIIF